VASSDYIHELQEERDRLLEQAREDYRTINRLREALEEIGELIAPYEVTTDTELEIKIRKILRASRPENERG
jgi:hypothetical protein